MRYTPAMTFPAPHPRALTLLSFALAFCLTGCVHRVDPPTLALEQAVGRAKAGTADAHELALAGFHALLVGSDAAQARAWFDASLAKQPAEPWALTGQATLGLRGANPMQVLTASLDVCERAPHHPLAAIAARLALDLVGQAKVLDDTIRTRVPGLLARGLSPDAAHLLRAALVNAHAGALDVKAQAATLSDMGMPTVGTLVGPFSPWHQLGMAEPTAVEKTGSLERLGTGPAGALNPRELHFADGRFSLSGEPGAADVYVLAVDVTVTTGGAFVLRTVTAMDQVTWLDGAKVAERLTWQHPASTVTAKLVRLEPGVHRVLVRMARENQQGHLSLALHRLDGQPAQLTFAPARGPAPRWSGLSVRDDEQLMTTASALHQALLEEGGDALARTLAARDAMTRDHDGASALADGLGPELTGAMVNLLRAELALQDRAIPARVGHGRANRELEAALTKDPGLVVAQLLSAQLVLDDGRQLEALEQVKRAKAATKVVPGTLLALQARIELALGLDAAAALTARDAATALGSSCDALLLQYDLARRRDAVADADALLPATSHCPGWLARSATTPARGAACPTPKRPSPPCSRRTRARPRSPPRSPGCSRRSAASTTPWRCCRRPARCGLATPCCSRPWPTCRSRPAAYPKPSPRGKGPWPSTARTWCCAARWSARRPATSCSTTRPSRPPRRSSHGKRRPAAKTPPAPSCSTPPPFAPSPTARWSTGCTSFRRRSTSRACRKSPRCRFRRTRWC